MSLRDTRPLATEAAVADHMGVPRRTLRQWRYLGKGPTFVKVGEHVRYRWGDVERWLEQQSAVPGAKSA